MILDQHGNPFASKAQTDSEKWSESSIRVIDTTRGYVRPEFNYDRAVGEFRSWVYAAIMLNANAVASLPLRLYVRNGSTRLFKTRRPSRRQRRYLLGDMQQQPQRDTHRKIMEFGEDFEEVTESHPILDLVKHVNPWYNGFDLMQLLVIYLESTGNAYWHPVIGQLDVPDEIWPMPSQWVQVVPDRELFIKGYVYGRSRETQQEFEPDEVIHFRTSNPSDEGLWYGKGKLEAAWQVVTLNTAAHDMDVSFAANRARPDYLAICKAGTTKDQLDRFEAKIEEKLKGVTKAGRFMAITADIELVPLQFSPKDLTGREDIVEEIAAVFGTPVSLLKANDPNLASARVGYASWKEIAILPIAKLIEQKLNESLLPLFGIDGDAVLAFDNPVPSDREFDLAEGKELVAVGVRTINEERAIRGDEPIEGGDVARVGGVPIDMIGQPNPALSPFTMRPSTGSGQPQPAESVAEPTAEPKPAAEPEVVSEQVVEVAPDSVLNGAQIQAAVSIVTSVVRGEIPRDAGLGQIEILFNLTPEQALKIMGSAGTEPPKPKEPVPIPPTKEPTEDEPDDAVRATARSVRSDHAHPHGKDGDHGDRGHTASTAATGRDPGGHAEVGSLKHTQHVYAKEVGAAEDTAREDQPAGPERALATAIASVFAAYRAKLDYRPKSVKRGTTEAEIDRNLRELDDLSKDLADAMRDPLRSMVVDGGQAGQGRLRQLMPDVPLDVFDVTNPAVQESVDRHVVRLSGQVSRTVTDGIRRVLSEGLAEGLSIDELADEIDSSGIFDPDRARMIARTESAQAYVEGEQESWRQSEVVEGKQWLLAPDPCPFCQATAKSFESANVTLDTPFYKVGDTITAADGSKMILDYRDITGPPLHPNCRCDVVPVLKEL